MQESPRRSYMNDWPDFESRSSYTPMQTKILKLSGEVPDDAKGQPLFSKFDDMVCSPSNPLQPTQYLLLPGHVLGYAIGKKNWGESTFLQECA
jgi:hypothetical protein